MCGICGIVGAADERLARTMADRMRHRGPDGEGILAIPSTNGHAPVTLGHRRLSIIDPTERGAQPMTLEGGRYTITYNGEIYNYRELRRELEADGVRFHSDCDTEVLLAMYARDGARVLDRVNGIFAFADLGRPHRRAVPGPGQARGQAALLRPGRRPARVRVRDQGDAAGAAAAVAAHRVGAGLPHVPVGARSGHPVRGDLEAAARPLRHVPERQAGRHRVLGHGLQRRRAHDRGVGARAAAGDPRGGQPADGL